MRVRADEDDSICQRVDAVTADALQNLAEMNSAVYHVVRGKDPSGSTASWALIPCTLKRCMRLPAFQAEFLEARRDVMSLTNARIQHKFRGLGVPWSYVAGATMPASVRRISFCVCWTAETRRWNRKMCAPRGIGTVPRTDEEQAVRLPICFHLELNVSDARSVCQNRPNSFISRFRPIRQRRTVRLPLVLRLHEEATRPVRPPSPRCQYCSPHSARAPAYCMSCRR